MVVEPNAMGWLTGFGECPKGVLMRAHSAEGPKVFVIVPVHNRRETTLGCLGALHTAGDLESVKVIVVDDGSTDGTGAAIRESFPGVIVLKGDGNLWWTGGIVMGMEEAVRRDADVIVWLNDDCHPRRGALKALVNHVLETGGIAVGQTFSSVAAPYSGWTKTAWGLRPVRCAAGTVAPCDTFPGNFVAFPRRVIDRIGYPDAQSFPHVFSDADYGLLARRHGFPAHVLGDAQATGIDSANPQAASWLLDERPARQIFGPLMRRTGALHPGTFWRYQTRHWGARGAAVWAGSYTRLAAFLVAKSVLPRAWLMRWRGRHSVAWQVRLAAEKRLAPGGGSCCGKKSGESP